MARVERRDKEPEPKPEPKGQGEKIGRRGFLGMAGTGVAGLVIGAAVGREAFPKEAPATAVPAEEEAAAPAAAPAAGEAAAPQYLAGYTLVFDPAQCTGCMKCAVACAEKWSAELFPEQTKDVVNLEFSRIRPMRF